MMNNDSWNKKFGNNNHSQYPAMYPIANRNKSQFIFASPQLDSSPRAPLALGSVQNLQRSESEILSTSYLPTQYAMVPYMKNLLDAMNADLYLIEQEKAKLQPNINLIQFLIHSHLQKIHEFRIRIPYLPLTNVSFNYKQPKMQMIPFNDYCESMDIKIPPNKIKNMNNNCNGNNIIIDDNTNIETKENEDDISLDQSLALTLQNDSIASVNSVNSGDSMIMHSTTSSQVFDIDMLKRSYSKQSLSGILSINRSISKVSRGSSSLSLPETPQPLQIHQHEPYLTVSNYHCQSIDQCKCIQNIIGALIFYQKCQVNQNKDDEENKSNDDLSDNNVDIKDLEDLFKNRYTNLVNDFHHILRHHLDCGTTETNNYHFERINDEISKYIRCNINTCNQYKRNERDRESKLSNGYFLQNESNEISIYTDILDTMHCYLLHSFDVAYRIKSKDQQKHIIQKPVEERKQEIIKETQQKPKYLNRNDSDGGSDEEINPCHYMDYELKNLKKFQSKKRRNLRNISGLSRRIKHYKFTTGPSDDESDEMENNNDEYKNKNDNDTSPIKLSDRYSRYSNNTMESNNNDDTQSVISVQSLASIASTVASYTSSSLSDNFRPHVNTYSFGNRFYYWPFYDGLNEKDAWNPGYKYSHWFIKARHNNLKEELLHNSIHRVDKQKYEMAKTKAKILIESDAFKQMKCDNHFFKDRYGVYKDDKIKLQHVMSLIFYTDYDKLCYNFSKTFRKIRPTETYKSLKKRNSNFANWARLLRESIECFGQKMRNVCYLYFISVFCSVCYVIIYLLHLLHLIINRLK